MKKPELGQILYSLNIGNAARHREQKLTPVEVVKVGRKYFSCRPFGPNYKWAETQYYLENWQEKTEYSANSCLYESQKAFEEANEATKIDDWILGFIRCGLKNKHITIDDLRKVKEILSKYDVPISEK
jgi:hypothetical protein